VSDVDVHRPKAPARGIRLFARVQERDDAALLDAEVVDGHARALRELASEQSRERLHSRLDRREAQGQRIAHGDAEPDLAGDVSFPVLEAPGVIADREGIGVDPRRGLEIDEGRLERADRVAAHVEKAGATRAAQILAPGGREHVAANAIDIDRELADRLAGVEQVEDAVPRGDGSHVRRWVDEPALGRHVGDRDESGPRPDRALERGHVDLSRGIVLDDVDLDTHSPLHLQEREVIRRVLGARGDDPVSGAEGDRVEGHVPGSRGVLDERDLVRAGADERGDGVVEVGDSIRRLGRRLVGTDGGFALQVTGHRLQDRAWRQRRPGVVEVQNLTDPRRVSSQTSNVQRQPSTEPFGGRRKS